MNKTYFNIITFFLLLFLITSCKKENYKNDGGIHSSNVNMTTYDYLKSHGSFDSLIRAIDLAGLKEMVNQSATFFAVPDWGVMSYLAVKKQEEIIIQGDENISFYMDDLDKTVLNDSLKMYMFNTEIKRENLNIKGDYFESMAGNLKGDARLYIRLRRTRDYSTYLDYVDYITVTLVRGTLDLDEPDITAIPEAERDISYDCQTTGIITTTGVLHVLSNQHRLFFNDQK